MKLNSVQAGQLHPGMIASAGGNWARVARVTALDRSVLPMIEIEYAQLPGERAPIERVRRIRSDERVTTAVWFHLKTKRLPVLYLVSCVSVKLERAAPAQEATDFPRSSRSYA